MNKKLLAIAVAAAMAAPAAAMAEATVYGKIHLSIESYDNGTAKGLDVSSNSSRLGFKGSEDLGGGLSGIWQYEFTVNPVESGSVSDDRNSYIGLKGGFGSFMVGRHDSPMKLLSRKADFFVDQIGDSRVITRGKAYGGDLEPRNANMLMYVTPKMGAISATLQYVPDNNTEDADDTTKTDLSVTFDQGGIFAGLAYQLVTAPTSADEDSTATMLVAGYGAGAFKVAAQYIMASDFANTAGADWNAYGLGGSFDLGGGNVIKAQYFANDVDSNDLNSTLVAVGYDHKFSKTTTAYVSYAQVSNDDLASLTTTTGTGHGALLGGAAGEDSSALSVGMMMSF